MYTTFPINFIPLFCNDGKYRSCSIFQALFLWLVSQHFGLGIYMLASPRRKLKKFT